jgi:hypothetical protein
VSDIIILDAEKESPGSSVYSDILILTYLSPLLRITNGTIIIITLMRGLILALFFVMPFEAGNEVFERKLSFAVIALSIGIMSEARHMHILTATFVRAESNIFIRVQNLSANTTWLQFRD